MSFAARSVPREPDLFTVEEIAATAHPAEAAKARLEAAQIAQLHALRRSRYAPHGEGKARLKALQEATHEVLRAAAELAAARAG